MISSITGKALRHLLNQKFSTMCIILELFALQDKESMGQVLPPQYPIFMRIRRENVRKSFGCINRPFLKYPFASKPVSCRYMKPVLVKVGWRSIRKKPTIVEWTTSSGRSAAEFNRRYGVLEARGCTDKEKVGHPYPVRKGWVDEWAGSEQEDGGINHNTKKGNGRTGGGPPRAARLRQFSSRRTRGFYACTRGCTKRKVPSSPKPAPAR